MVLCLNTISIDRRQWWLPISWDGVTFRSLTLLLHLLFTRVKSIIASASPPNLNVISRLFLFWKQVYIHQVQPFTNCPIELSDSSIFYLTNPKTPVNLSKTTHITTNMVIKSLPTNTSLVTTFPISS